MIGKGGTSLIGSQVQQQVKVDKKGPRLTIYAANRNHSDSSGWTYSAKDVSGFIDKKAISGSDETWELAAAVQPQAQQTARIEIQFNDVVNAVRGISNGQVAGTKCLLKYEGMSTNLYLEGVKDRIGHITAPVKDNVGSVETVQIDNRYQKFGFGRLLAAAFYAQAENAGAKQVRLGTQDTSGGFWGHLGMNLNTIALLSAKSTLGRIKVVPNPTPEEFDFTDQYKTRVIY